jgi:hypothetical protein
MSTTLKMLHPSRTWAAGTLAVLTVAAGGLAVVAPTASAARLPGCVATHLAVAPAGVDAATSHRYSRFRLTNTGDHTCRLYGTPTFRFRDSAGDPVGHPSTPSGQRAHVVVLQPGQHTRVVVGYVVPQVTLPSQCRSERAATVDIRLAYRSHVQSEPLRARVCTTARYRPTGYPVGF